jgi:hypothetical protein
MAGPYRNNVHVAAGNDGTFDPPLDAIQIIVAPASAKNFVINGETVSIPTASLGRGLFEVGGITSITGDASFRYIGLRVLNKSGSSNVTNDSITETEGG